MALNIEIPVSLGLQTAEGQVNHLRKILSEAVKIDSNSFRGLSLALLKAENDVARLKSLMKTAFLSAAGSKKFLADYDKLFESLATIGNRFGFLKESEMIFSPENAEAIKNARTEMAQLSDEIQQIKSGKVGKLFEDESIASVKEVREVANELGVTLSKTTFLDFGLKISGAMTEALKNLDETRKLVELLKEAAKSADLKKDSIFSQLNIDKLMGNTAEVIDKNGAKTLRELIAKLYEEYGLTDVELGKNIKAGSNIDKIFIAEEERVKASSEKYIGILQELKNKIQEEIDKFDEGLKQSGGEGKRANWESKLAYINEIKLKFAGLLTFSDVPASVLKDGTGITKYVESFKQELINGMKDLSTDDITRVLLEKVLVIFNSVSTKSVITDLGSFKQLITVMMKETFGDLNLGDITNGISAGWDFDKAIEMVMANIKTALQSLDPKELEEKAVQYEAALQKLTNANKTVSDTERVSIGSLKEKEAAFLALVEEVTKYVAALLGITTGLVQAVLRGDADAANQGRTALEGYILSLTKLLQKLLALGNILSAVNRWMGFWQVLNMTKSAINDMKLHLQELDTVMTSIAVVTNFSQDDLWGLISLYSEIARQYGVAIKGVYEVSLIYYQLGLLLNDVMTLTTETLKMARIAGLDYATAADYMTTAIRGFKLEMQDAAHVTDVFSALAATTASSTEEIATAISKTAASALAVGASFEATSAMMATMIATTRESATNIGTALKSVISRYGEMTSDPSKTVDAEGEEMSLNRVDKALLTVGITIHDTAGLFRDFDDVMLELMEKWDSLDSLSQRYIATLMAGNRQQSRFLALVSNVDEYKKALLTAMDSEGAGELLTLKTLDSIDAKIEKMKVTIQEFYTSSGLEELYKNILDTITNIVSAANSLPKIFGKFPAIAVSIGANLITTIKSVMTLFISSISAGLELVKGQNTSILQAIVEAWRLGGRRATTAFSDEAAKGMAEGQGKILASASNGSGKFWEKPSLAKRLVATYAGAAFSALGSILTINSLNQYGASSSVAQDQTAGALGILGSVGSVAGGAASGFATGGIPGAIIGGLASAVTLIPNMVSALGMINVNIARQVLLAEKSATEARTEASKLRAETQGLLKAVTTYKELESLAYSSAEAMQDFKDHINTLAESYPLLITSMDDQGNYLIELSALEEALAASREKTAIATANATQAELEAKKQTENAWESAANLTSGYNDFINLNSYSLDWVKLQGSWDNLWRAMGLDSDFYIGENAEEKLLNLYNLLVPNEDLIKELGDFNDNTIRNKIGNVIGNFINTDTSGLLNVLKNLIKTLLGIDSSLSLEELTGFSDVGTILESQLNIIKAVLTLNKRANDYLGYYDTVITNLGNTFVRDRSKVSLGKIASLDLSKKFDYTKYENLISNLVSENQDLLNLALKDSKESNEFEDAVDERTKEYTKYFIAHLDTLNFLNEELNLNAISSLSSLDKILQQNIVNDAESNVDEELVDTYKKRWQETRTELLKDYSNLLESIFGEENVPKLFGINENGELNTEFSNNTLSIILSNFSVYKKMLDKSQYALADSYLHIMEKIYGPDGIGKLSDEESIEAFSVIKDLDLSDPEALRTAAETFEGMGSEFEGLSNIFTNAALRWATNAATLLEQLVSSTLETAKSIESSTSDMSKVFKYSEALEKAQALMDANEGVKFDELFTFDKDVGGYVKTAKAFLLEMAKLLNLLYDSILLAINDNLNILPQFTEIEDLRNLYLSDKVNDEIKGDKLLYAKALFSDILKQNKDFKGTDEDIDRLWIEYTNMIEAFEALKETGEKDWNTFVEQYLKQLGSDLTEQLKAIQEMPLKMAQEALLSFDYKSIVSGQGTIQNKETLKALLVSSGGEHYASDIAYFFDEYYTKLITGNIDEYNKYLKQFGLSGFLVSEGEANRARFEAVLTAANELSDNIAYEALSDSTKTLLKQYGITSAANYTSENIASAANNLEQAVFNYINSGIASIAEVAAYLDERAADKGAGKLKILFDAYNDLLFTRDELIRLGALTVTLDKEGNIRETLTESWQGLIEFNNTQNAYVLTTAKKSQSIALILQELADAAKITIDTDDKSYKDILKSSTSDYISSLEEADSDTLATNILNQLKNATKGTRIDASNSPLALYILRQAGFPVDKNGILTISTDEMVSDIIDQFDTIINQNQNEPWEQVNSATIKLMHEMARALKVDRNKFTAISSILTESFDYSTAEKFSKVMNATDQDLVAYMETLGYKYDKLANTFFATAEVATLMQTQIDNYLAQALAETDQDIQLHLIEKANNLQSALNVLIASQDYKKANALIEVLSNANNITEGAIESFNNAFGAGILDEFISKPDVQGNRKLNLTGLRAKLLQTDSILDSIFSSYIGEYADNYTSSLESAVSYVTSGTTNRTGMEAFVKLFQEATGDLSVTVDSAFIYNKDSKNWKLNADLLYRYAEARANLLKLVDDEYITYVQDMVSLAYLDAIDLSGFFSSDLLQSDIDKLNQLLIDYYTNLFADEREEALNNIKLSTGAILKSQMIASAGFDLSILAGKTIKSIEELEKDALEEAQIQINKDYDDLIKNSAELNLKALLGGGEAALEVYKKLKPKATEEELAKVYSNAFNTWSSAFNALSDVTPGTIVAGKLKEVLEELGMANYNGVVNSAFDMVAAYAAIYAEMSATEGRTIAGLNEAYAKLLTAQDLKNIDITEALSNAGGMTYEALGALLTKYSELSLLEFIASAADNGIYRTGFGKIQIKDWNTFAESVFGELTSEILNSLEYISAFKAYNDGIISMNKLVEKAIVEEVKLIGSAKAGDWLNFSQLFQVLGNELSDLFTEEIKGYGAILDKGILKLDEDANLLGISQTLQAMMDSSDITEEIEEVHDLVLLVLKSYAEAITKGILGGLSNVERQDLINKASDLNIGEIDFIETADGFKLVETSAIDLYYALKNIDSLHAGLIFDALREELEKTRDEFDSVASLTNHITKIRNGTYLADSKISNARKEQYEAELQIAEEILAVRSATEDDSFKFMEQDIPSGLNNPLNYWNNWKTAFDSIKEGKRTGKMDYKDFYNLITEMGNLSAMMGGKGIQIGKDLEVNSENVAELITKAGKHMEVAKDGSLKINLKGIGVDFAASAADMQTGIDEGIDTLARSLISMLDGVILLLETIVAMEKLGDLDSDSDMKITLPELLLDDLGNKDGDLDEKTGYIKKYGSKYDEIRNILISTFTNSDNENLRKAYENVKYHGHSLNEILTASEKDLLTMGITGKDLAKLVDGLWQLSISDEWDINDPVLSLYKLISLIDDFSLSIDLGTHSISIGSDGLDFSIEWDSQAVKDKIVTAASAAGIEPGKTPDEIVQMAKDALKQTESGQKIELELNYLLKVANGDIKVSFDENKKPKYWTVGNQRFDSYEKSVIASDLYKATGLLITLTEIDDGQAQVKIKKGNTEIIVESEGKGALWRDPNHPDKHYPSWDALQDAMFKESDEYNELLSEHTEAQELEAKKKYNIRMGFEVVPTIEGSLKDSSAETVKLIQKSIQNALQNGDWKLVKIDAKDLGIELNFSDLGPTYDLQLEILEFFGLKDTTTISNAITSAFSNFKITEADIDTSGIDKIIETINKAIAAAEELSKVLKTIVIPEDTSGSKTPKIDERGPINPKFEAKKATAGLANNATLRVVLPPGVKATSDDEIKVVTTGTPTLDTTAWPLDLGNAPLKVGSFFTATNEIIIKLKKFKIDLGNGTNNAENNVSEMADTISDASLQVSSDAQNLSSTYSDAMDTLDTKTQDASGSASTHLNEMLAAATTAIGTIISLLGGLPTHISMTFEARVESNDPNLDGLTFKGGFRGENIADLETITTTIEFTTEGAEAIEETKLKAEELVTTPVSADTTEADGKIAALTAAATAPEVKPVDMEGNIGGILELLNSAHFTALVHLTSDGVSGSTSTGATGNLAMAQGTLMGELGPELVVSHGRYFVAGLSGAEFVNLDSDAIVFNHLQTQQLLKNGMSSGRGKALTNERNAVAFASGNVNGGPAMASASAALNALKLLRAMWESLLGASVTDLAKGGGGGGGGGNKIIDPKAWIDTVERWYNLTLEIAKLEKQITHEEALRSKLLSDFLKNGKAYYRSLRASLNDIRAQIAAQEQLNLSREEYYDRRVSALKELPFGEIYTFDDKGQLQFRKDVSLTAGGKTYSNAMEWLTNVYGFDENQKANYTNKEKYEIFKANGMGDSMLYDSNGMEIKPDADNSGDITDEEWETFYENATNALKDRVDEYALATQSLWDEIQEGKTSVLELMQLENELLEEMRQNLLDLESSILDAVVESRQRLIDALQDEREALEDSTSKFIDGLSKNLAKEQELYLNQSDKNELNRLKRLRDILARSGGSASAISGLDDEIASKSLDMYFDMLLKLIDAILEASDLELERLDNLINIMTETLEYLKKYGLLWELVYEVMAKSPAEIASFLEANTEKYWGDSPLASIMQANDWLFLAEQWVEYRKDTGVMRDLMIKDLMKKDYETYDAAMKKEFGDNYDPNGKYKAAFEAEYNNSYDITKASTAGRKAYTDDKLAAEKAERERKAAEEAAKAQLAAPAALALPLDATFRYFTGYEHNATHHWRYSVWSDGSRNRINYETHSFTNGKCKCGATLPNKGPTGQGTASLLLPNKILHEIGMVGNASGGYVKEPTISWLAENGEEAVFNAEQTRILRENILSNKPNSLISLLAAYNDAYKDGTVPSTTNSQSLVIESATVNMNVSKISNDYDARRAGEQALEEMMRIARKTGATNSIRR